MVQHQDIKQNLSMVIKMNLFEGLDLYYYSIFKNFLKQLNMVNFTDYLYFAAGVAKLKCSSKHF